MKGKDVLSITDLAPETVYTLLHDALELKTGKSQSIPPGKVLALLFEKPSLRTRVSFEVAMMGIGGKSLYLSPAEVGLGKREPVEDVARVLDRYVDIIAARTFSHSSLEKLGNSCRIPVINALSDIEHPCQALADMLTILEKKGEIKGLSVAYVGDGNNVAASLMLACAMLGADFTIASPEGYRLKDETVSTARAYGAVYGAAIRSVTRAKDAAAGADVIYTDTWTSMGQEEEAEKRRNDFRDYQVNSELLYHAPESVIVMHCLPAHRGEEITSDIMEGPHSVVFDQAENRMYAARALLLYLLGGLEITVGS